MKKLLTVALIFGSLSSLGHFYLAKRAYQLEAGEASASKICSIGENINCDSALLSPYAKISGVSISNFGVAFNLFLSLLLLCFLFFGANNYWKNISFYTAGGIAFFSIPMAVISLTNSLFCPVCWALYCFSFVQAGCLFFVFKQDLSQPITFIKKNWKQKNSYIVAGGLFLLSLFFHINFVTTFDIKSQKEMLDAVFFDWQNEKPINLPESYLLQKGKKDSQITLVEFADFLCPICKRVQTPIENFLDNFPNANFKFYVYPLDKACNPSLKFGRTGLSCELSQAIVCANKQNKGWLAHDFFFEFQNNFIASQGDKNKIKKLFSNMISQTGINKQQFELCMKAPSTMEKVKQSALAGKQANIDGTPSFFINGKKVNQDSPKLLIFRKIHNHLRKTK